MKRLSVITAAVVAASALALSGCSEGPASTEPTAATGGDDTITIGFSISTLQNPFFVSMEEGIDEAAAASGIEVTLADANDDPLKQANDILNFISSGVDVAVLNPTDGDAIVSSVEALNEAGIPVITVDRRAEGGDVLAHIGTDNVTAGEATAKAFFEAIGGKGKIAILEGVPGASSSIDRGTGFENVLADYPEIEVVATQTANYQRSEGLTVAQNILQATPDLAGFLSMNDEMALGAIEAIRSAGKGGAVKVIGIDGGADAVKAVEAGELVATIAQQSALMGSMGIEQAIKVAKGEKIEKDQPVDVIVIDESNVDEYL
ncbi:substrate-binding domain-containing protein [Cellulomonas xiejunii]|uniref:Substrate-binding domain-containing protein n=1 Tax=Cellulomonas xiejunii TaxID=2968083 RepID=A0ABY5KL30_9CELL|nr:substrate-binding domain-containing protein [Cellulomonas xiejunii]MCC2315927.1 substrate-binding domain-containing protein [Cellulomonas xiejunii]MCC2320944.1 substrate-binding domain-containing protein [Cellulomonas xiejunii]UUI71224.1 substrate-binding domain-containing protein [Cellulomonas xiejunii]